MTNTTEHIFLVFKWIFGSVTFLEFSSWWWKRIEVTQSRKIKSLFQLSRVGYKDQTALINHINKILNEMWNISREKKYTNG